MKKNIQTEYVVFIYPFLPYVHCYFKTCKTGRNALFNYYREMAASEQIEMDWNIRIPEPLTISELYLCSILGNLIENALAGCNKEKSRGISVYQAQRGGRRTVLNQNNY